MSNSTSTNTSKIDDSILRILIATDNHLGYCEKDTIRGSDSFITFEEVLQLAVDEKVDFILLGGDLFHDAVPSQNALHKCMRLLRSYIFGDEPVEFEVLNAKRHFSNVDTETVNYQDPNINICLPIFSIHGNHDDPSSFGGLSALDLFSTTGLMNYFGRATDLTQIDIHPLMIRKGDTHLALYGLSHIHDARLARLFENEQVNIILPNLNDIDPELMKKPNEVDNRIPTPKVQENEMKRKLEERPKGIRKGRGGINTRKMAKQKSPQSESDSEQDISLSALRHRTRMKANDKKNKGKENDKGKEEEIHANNTQVPVVSEKTPDWFHLMVLHQNHADRGPKNYLPEGFLPKFMDFIIWGHEHDSYAEADYNALHDFYVYQPGSTVATSLSEGESLQKHAAVLQIYQNKFKLKPIPLQTIRPFVFKSINIPDVWDELNLDDGDVSNKVRTMAEEKIEEMITMAKKKITGHPMQPKLPLIRLRLVYSDEEQMFNAIRLGQKFHNRVANPADIVHFKKLKKQRETKDEAEVDVKIMKLKMEEMQAEKPMERVEDFLVKYFEHEAKDCNKLEFLSIKLLLEMNNQLICYNDNNAAENLLEKYQMRALNHLMEKNIPDSELNKEVANFQKNVTDDYIQQLLCADMKSIQISKSNNISKTARLRDEKWSASTMDNTISSSTSTSTFSSSTLTLNGKRAGTSNFKALSKDDFCKMFKNETPATKPSRGGRSSTATAAGRKRGNTSKGTRDHAASSDVSITSTTNDSTVLRSNNKMKQLEITINSKSNSSSSQRSISSLIGGGRNPSKSSKIKTFVISDESD